MGAQLCMSSGCKQVISTCKKISFLVYKIGTTHVICPLGKTWAKQSNSKVPAIIPFNASVFSCLWQNKREVSPRLPWFPFWKRSGWLTVHYSADTSVTDSPGGPHPHGSSSQTCQGSHGSQCDCRIPKAMGVCGGGVVLNWALFKSKVLHLLPESPEHRLKHVSFTPFWLLKVEQIGEISIWCLWGILTSCLRVPHACLPRVCGGARVHQTGWMPSLTSSIG